MISLQKGGTTVFKSKYHEDQYTKNWKKGKVPNHRYCQWPLKVCAMCSKEKPRDHFFKSKSTQDGLSGRCKSCATPPKTVRKLYEKRHYEKSVIGQWLEDGGGPISSKACSWPNKNCTGCRRDLPRVCFSKRSENQLDGKEAKCKECLKRKKKPYKRPPNLKSEVKCACGKRWEAKRAKEEKARLKEERKEEKYKEQLERSLAKSYLRKGTTWGKSCEWPLKTCKSCGVSLPRVRFNKVTQSMDGYSYSCKDCAQTNKKPRRPKDKADRRAKRRYAEKLATPGWLSKEQKRGINKHYEQARDCTTSTGERYEVNHIVPLRGENVCGLHVPWNLEVLPRYINYHIGNNFDGGW